MRVVIVSPDPPVEPLNGLRLPLRQLIEDLVASHDVHLLTALRTNDDLSSLPSACTVSTVPACRDHVAHLARSLLTYEAVDTRAQAEALSTALSSIIDSRRPDVVHVFSGRLARLGSTLQGTPSVLSAFDALHLNAEASARVARGVARIRHLGAPRRARRFQRRTYPLFDRIVLVTDEDRAELEQLGVPRTEVVPNGVDVEYFAAGRHTPALDRLVFHGVLRYPPNVDAARYLANEIFPRVRAARPSATLELVGRSPVPAVRELEQLDGVEVRGDVPDVRPHLGEAAVYVCPMRLGTGIKNKLLEAMASGAPCVATPLALQGIDAISGRDVLVGHNADELADATIRLLTDRGLARQVAEAGRWLVARERSWAAVSRRHEELYASVLNEKSEPRIGVVSRVD